MHRNKALKCELRRHFGCIGKLLLRNTNKGEKILSKAYWMFDCAFIYITSKSEHLRFYTYAYIRYVKKLSPKSAGMFEIFDFQASKLPGCWQF